MPKSQNYGTAANVDAAVEHLIWFYRGGAEQKEESGGKRTVQLGYDFEQNEDAL